MSNLILQFDELKDYKLYNSVDRKVVDVSVIGVNVDLENRDVQPIIVCHSEDAPFVRASFGPFHVMDASTR